MSIKTFKPTTPSRRHMTVSGFDGIDKHAKPESSLTEVLKKNAGRNSYGRITVRHHGGGNRQKMMYKMVLDICRKDFAFADFEECSQFFKGLINLFRQMNYSEWQSEKFEGYRKQIEEYVSEKIK